MTPELNKPFVSEWRWTRVRGKNIPIATHSITFEVHRVQVGDSVIEKVLRSTRPLTASQAGNVPFLAEPVYPETSVKNIEAPELAPAPLKKAAT